VFAQAELTDRNLRRYGWQRISDVSVAFGTSDSGSGSPMPDDNSYRPLGKATDRQRGDILTEDWLMSPSLSELLKLPAGERAELAMALWDSLSEAEREGELELTPEEGEELDRRWSDHVQRPDSSIPWAEVRRKLLDRE
jgi:putative addiction module component (TIGR02574 family)